MFFSPLIPSHLSDRQCSAAPGWHTEAFVRSGDLARCSSARHRRFFGILLGVQQHDGVVATRNGQSINHVIRPRNLNAPHPTGRMSGCCPGRAFQVIQASGFPEFLRLRTAPPFDLSSLAYVPLLTHTTSPGCTRSAAFC